MIKVWYNEKKVKMMLTQEAGGYTIQLPGKKDVMGNKDTIKKNKTCWKNRINSSSHVKEVTFTEKQNRKKEKKRKRNGGGILELYVMIVLKWRRWWNRRTWKTWETRKKNVEGKKWLGLWLGHRMLWRHGTNEIEIFSF